MPSARRLALASLVALSATACGGDDGQSPERARAALAGTWVLERVNGQPLPYHYERFGQALCIQASTLTLAATVGVSRLRDDIGATAGGGGCADAFHDEHEIAYGVDGDRVTIRMIFPLHIDTFAATVDGDVLTVTFANAFRTADGTYRYRRP